MSNPVELLTVNFEVAAEGDAPGLTVIFALGEETPQVGKPGKLAGDWFLTESADGAQRVTISLGSAAKCAPEMVRRAGGALGKWLVSHQVGRVTLDLDSLQQSGWGKAAGALLEGIALGAYRFDRYKSDAKSAPKPVVLLRGGAGESANAALIAQTKAVAGAVLLSRSLAHEPANVINPVTLAEQARSLGESAGLKVTVLTDEELVKMGAGAIVGVGQGSANPSRLIVLEYTPDGVDATHPVALVGKAITFDTGGYSLKSTDGIVGMKYDKSGGMTVLATLLAAPALQFKTPLVGVIAAAENMISGIAYRPDDILTSLSGKTIEIITTDAEGRLVLADALTYTQRTFHPRVMIDLATLTGGVVVALGHVRAGLMSNDDTLADALMTAGEETFERLWRLPLDEEFVNNIKGDDADLKNSGGREGSTILGGAFLSQFVEEDTPWAHIDIAGMANTAKDAPYAPKGSTGFGVRLLLNYLKTL